MNNSIKATITPGSTLLTPMDHTLILVDHQSQMAFAVKSIDAIDLRNNAALVAKAAKSFQVSTILTSVAEKTFSGPVFDEIKDSLSDIQAIDRTTMNCWEDENIIAEVNRLQKTRIVFAGLWTAMVIKGIIRLTLSMRFFPRVHTLMKQQSSDQRTSWIFIHQFLLSLKKHLS